MINITEEAGKHLQTIMDTQQKYIMLGVKGGGCAGFSYDWQLLEEPPTNAESFKLESGSDFYVDNMSLMYLFGSTIDLKKDVFGTVLEVQTPAAASACGCGESINFDMDYIDANMPPELGQWDQD